MCMEDIAIARATKTRIYRTSTSISIPANPNRLAVRLTCVNGDQAELWYPRAVAIGAFSDGDILIGWCSRLSNTLVGEVYGYTLFDDVSLDRVGVALLGELRLDSTQNVQAVAIETYLDLNDPSLAKWMPSHPSAGDINKSLLR